MLSVVIPTEGRCGYSVFTPGIISVNLNGKRDISHPQNSLLHIAYVKILEVLTYAIDVVPKGTTRNK